MYYVFYVKIHYLGSNRAIKPINPNLLYLAVSDIIMKNPDEEPNIKEFIVQNRKNIILRKIYTPNGNRIEISSGENKEITTLDAMQLESLTWQEREKLSQLHEQNASVKEANRIRKFWNNIENSEPKKRENITKITNEYAEVYINTVLIGGKECCEIVSPKVGYGARLTPEELLSVAECGYQIYNQFLQTPFGPEKKYEE